MARMRGGRRSGALLARRFTVSGDSPSTLASASRSRSGCMSLIKLSPRITRHRSVIVPAARKLVPPPENVPLRSSGSHWPISQRVRRARTFRAEAVAADVAPLSTVRITEGEATDMPGEECASAYRHYSIFASAARPAGLVVMGDFLQHRHLGDNRAMVRVEPAPETLVTRVTMADNVRDLRSAALRAAVGGCRSRLTAHRPLQRRVRMRNQQTLRASNRARLHDRSACHIQRETIPWQR